MTGSSDTSSASSHGGVVQEGVTGTVLQVDGLAVVFLQRIRSGLEICTKRELEFIKCHLETGLDILQLEISLGNLGLVGLGHGGGQLAGALSGNLQGSEWDDVR